jgi:D-alanine-D-alanine ligase
MFVLKKTKARVGVLRGGPSREYDISLKTGASILRNLSDRFQSVDILVTKGGVWHMFGLEVDHEEVFDNIDVAANAFHGDYGEDGKVQNLLDNFSVPYTGAGSLASSLGLNKKLSKELFEKIGLKTPRHKSMRKEDDDVHALALEAFKTIPLPCIIKPATSGSSLGVSLAHSFRELEEAMRKAYEYSNVCIVEEYIRGREASCGVIDSFRNREVYPLFPVEVLKREKDAIFTYDSKYIETLPCVCPGRFSRSEMHDLQDIAVLAHKALGLRDYSRSDFIVSPKGIYLLEVNSLPALVEGSLYPVSLESVGLSMPKFLDHVIELALERK